MNVINTGFTSIGNEAFRKCTSLTSITIGNGVISIGDKAFSWCTKLTSITIGNGVTSIGNEAFRKCTSLTSITIGNGVTSIGKWAFIGLTIPNSVTSIDNGAFIGCKNLKKIYYPAGADFADKLRAGNNAELIPYKVEPPAQVEPSAQVKPPAAKQNLGWQRDANGTFIYYPSNSTPVQVKPPAQIEPPVEETPPAQVEPLAQVKPSFNLTPLPTQMSLFDSPPPAETNCTVYRNTKISRAENIAPLNTKSLSRVDENIAEIRRAAELAAMNIVMTIEGNLGFVPVDVSSQNLGYDIKSTSRDGKISRLIEVKGRHIDAETVTVSRNEIDAALNNPDNFILAIVKLDGGKNETTYLKRAFEQPPDRAALSVNFSIQKLVEAAKSISR